jgi:hypothetical protein
MRIGIQEKMDRGRQKVRATKAAAFQAVERKKDGLAAAVDACKHAYREATGRAAAR